jgi:hypothetical protein
MLSSQAVRSLSLFLPLLSHTDEMIPDWMNEGGQSSTGQLLDFMIDTHPASSQLKSLAKEKGMNHFALLEELLHEMAGEKGAPFLSYLTKDYYLYPDLHGTSLSELARIQTDEMFKCRQSIPPRRSPDERNANRPIPR